MSKDNTLIWVIVGVMGILALFYFVGMGKNSESSDTSFLKVRMYDESGNLIQQGSDLSVVNNVPGVSFIDLTVSVRNTGDIPLTCDILSASPTAFDTALTKSSRIIPIIGEKKGSWTSSLISVSQFEGSPTPDVFSATIRCSYVVGTKTTYLPDKTGSLSLTINSEGQGSFEVDVSSGGTGTEYCGDGICQSYEDSASCPADCAVFSNVKFRTTDLAYSSGGAIAYTSSCGNTLTAYGHVSSSSLGYSVTTNCSHMMKLGSYALVMSDLPGGWIPGWNSPSLWKTTTNVRVCQDKADSKSVYIREYSTSDPDASKVSTDKIATGSKEIAC